MQITYPGADPAADPATAASVAVNSAADPDSNPNPAANTDADPNSDPNPDLSAGPGNGIRIGVDSGFLLTSNVRIGIVIGSGIGKSNISGFMKQVDRHRCRHLAPRKM